MVVMVAIAKQSDFNRRSGAAHNSRILNAGNTWRALGVISSGARHPNQASLTTRLATFDRWPADKTQLPRSMAEAGFFLTGADDQVNWFLTNYE